jgi:hypothetical protein
MLAIFRELSLAYAASKYMLEILHMIKCKKLKKIVFMLKFIA